jgi:hypothetical protein
VKFTLQMQQLELLMRITTYLQTILGHFKAQNVKFVNFTITHKVASGTLKLYWHPVKEEWFGYLFTNEGIEIPLPKPTPKF